MQTASGYVRLSQTADARNLSLEGMQRDVERVAALHGLELQHLRVDNGISGAVRNRPEFTAWLRDDVDVLIAYSVDRMTREGLTVAAMILERLEGNQYGRRCRLLDCHGLDSNHGEAFRFQFVIQAEIGRAELARMRQRVRDMRARAKATGRFGGGVPPYGWRNDNGTLVPVEAEQAVLQEIGHRILAGYSLGDVSRFLNATGVTTRRQLPWQRNTVRQLLFTDVSQQTWTPSVLLALREAVTSGETNTRGRKPSRLLSGLLVCGNCGTRMVVNRNAYICPARGRGQPCPKSVAITIESAERSVETLFLARYGRVRATTTVVEVVNHPEVEQAAKDKMDAMLALSKKPTQADFDKLQHAQAILDNPPVALTTTREVELGTFAEEWSRRDTDGKRALLASFAPQIPVLDASHAARLVIGSDWHENTIG